MIRFSILFFICSILINTDVAAQVKNSRWYFGPYGGFTISRTFGGSDTFAPNFSRRNKLSPMIGIATSYSLSRNVALIFSPSFVGKGYKITNDTLGNEGEVARSIYAINLPIGISFKQNFNSQNFFKENFGLSMNYNFVKDSTIIKNDKTNTAFQLVELNQRRLYPMFYLGVELGGGTESGNRYLFGVTYFQSFSKDANIRIQYGENLAKNFMQQYRGGFLQVGFTYQWNISNVKRKKSGDGYEYD